MSEINDEQLQEFEAKLEALTQRLEEIELSPDNFDPFDLYDVERMLEDFRTKEQSLNSEVERVEVEGAEVEESFSFEVGSVSKKRPVFEVHWIGIDECNVSSCESIISDVEAKSAFLNAINYRADYSNGKRKVKHGDLLILLCRNSGNLAEDAPEGSEPLTKSCTYMGMFTRHGYRQSAEPDALPVVESKISDSNDYGDVFVWSSCSEGNVCDEDSTAVDILTVSESDSGQPSSFTFLKSGSASSPYESGVLDYVTDLSVAKANLGTTTKGLVIDSAVTDVTAGYHGSLKKLSASLSNWYVDFSKKKFKVKSDVGSITTGTFNFGSSGSALINKPLLSDECGNLRISIYTDSSTIDLFTGSLSSTSENFSDFAKNISVSLGTLEDIDTSEVSGNIGIAAEITAVSKFEADGTEAKKIFFPAINENDAGSILTTDSISYLENYELTIEARYTVVYEDENKGDAEYYFYKKEKKVNEAKFASGLFYDGGNEDPDGTEKTLLGVIRVKEIPLRYGCNETYGCQLDPAGEYYDSSCGSGCEVAYEPMLTYRPPYVYVYYYNFANKCYTLKSEHVRDDTDERNDISNHYYSNGGRYTAEIIDGQTETIFYVNDAKETDVVRSSPVAEAEICKTFDSELADFSDQYSGTAEIHTQERDFIPITVGASIKIQFFPRILEDQITVWYRKDGDYIALIDEVTLTINQEDGAAASGGVFIGAGGPIDSEGFEWVKEIPVGADAIKLEVDGTVSGDADTMWRYQIEKA
ncbi:MAG TPA: hypothetical protein DCY51_04140 [Bacteroidetes bacterium]|nr:hypothetical protein [Bacteroidota bacterium]